MNEQQPRSDASKLLDPGLRLAEQGMREAFRALTAASYFSSRFTHGFQLPAVRAVLDLQFEGLGQLAQLARGERDLASVSKENWSRFCSGARYETLVLGLGRQVWGSARREGERVLAEDSWFRLTYLPAKEGVEQGPPVFHAGGVLPYGDGFFRFMPETCLFDRFTERGLPVYALELKGDRYSLDYRDLTLEKVVDSIAHFAGLAFDHAGHRKMILEGYCGLAAHVLAYVAARPLDANSRFKVVANFVGPVDGTRCGALSQIMAGFSESLLDGSYAVSERLHEYVSGDQLRLTQDLALDASFPKTPVGRFLTGWKHPEYAAVEKLEDLTFEQRRDLAGAYWISAENCRRFPVPVDLARYSSGLFRQGVSETGQLPAKYKGQPLSLADALKGTQLQFVGFYGGKDVLVPDSTADVVRKVMGDRYTHVVHPSAGHVSYVFSPKIWDPASPKGLKPNPVDLLLELYAR